MNEQMSAVALVRKFLEKDEIKYEEQSSQYREIDEVFKGGSKSGKGGKGFPDFIAYSKDFIIFIECKADLAKHCKLDSHNIISDDFKHIKDYALNGALHYGKYFTKNNNTEYKKILAIGVSGSEKRYKITPIYISERGDSKQLQDLINFTDLKQDFITDYYKQEILNIPPDTAEQKLEIEKFAKKLHEDLRNYGAIADNHKPLIVAGILLALQEMGHQNLSLEHLNNDSINTDGDKLYKLIDDNLKRSQLEPQVKRDKVLSEFLVIKNTQRINEKSDIVDSKGMQISTTPLKYYAKEIKKEIYDKMQSSVYKTKKWDILGMFYSEFMRFSGGSGQTLGIVLTPFHITELFCDLVDIKPTDRVLDPTCGTGGFLISAMDYMLKNAKDIAQQNRIKKEQLFGYELQSFMFAVATTNMLLRGDGKSNLLNENFLSQNPKKLQIEHKANIGFMNPPYSQGKIDKSLTEIAFSEHLLDSILEGGKVVVIVPQSAMTGKSKEEKAIKASILQKHTLEGVITLNKETFYGVGTNPCIAVFTAGIPHPKEKLCKFINFEDDGFEVQKHRGLVETIHAKSKKSHLLDVWFDRMEAESKFCVKTTIEESDEWLHSFYYFNDEIPKLNDFEKTMADYLTFEFNMITHGRGYLFGLEEETEESKEG